MYGVERREGWMGCGRVKGGEANSVTLGGSCVYLWEVDGVGAVCRYFHVLDGWAFEIWKAYSKYAYGGIFFGALREHNQAAWCIGHFVWRGSKYLGYWPRLRKGKGAARAGLGFQSTYTLLTDE